jgi:hypothetical protein
MNTYYPKPNYYLSHPAHASEKEEEKTMNLDLASNIYFTLGAYLFVCLLIGVACFGITSYLMGRFLPRIRTLISSVSAEGRPGRDDQDLHLAHGRPV